MTTILLTRDNIYCDTQVTSGNTVHNLTAIKFMPLSSGKLAIGAGTVSGVMATVAKYEGVSNELIDTYLPPAGRSSLVVISPDGFAERYKAPRIRGGGASGDAGSRGVSNSMFWDGTADFAGMGSGSPHLQNYFEFIGDDPKEAMMYAASKDVATCEYFFELPRRWDKDKPLIAKFYHGKRNSKTFKKPHEIVVPFPDKPEWIIDALCGKRPVYEIDISQFVK